MPPSFLRQSDEAIFGSDAMLDGAQVDDGTAWEIGYAYAKGIPVIGLRTDFRLCADSDGGLVNAMIQGSVLCMCRSADEVLGVLGMLRRGGWLRRKFSHAPKSIRGAGRR